MSGSASSFKLWQQRQQELHKLEQIVASKRRSAGQGYGKGVSEELLAEVEKLRQEVDALFPLAMEEQEKAVAAALARRYKLGD